jgi:hypothetical protein
MATPEQTKIENDGDEQDYQERSVLRLMNPQKISVSQQGHRQKDEADQRQQHRLIYASEEVSKKIQQYDGNAGEGNYQNGQ